MIEKVTSSANLIGLESEESRVLQANIGHSLCILLNEGSVEGFVEKLLYTLITSHTPFEADEGQSGLNMSRGILISELFVKEASFWHLLLLLFKHGVLDHQLNKIANLKRTFAVASNLKLGARKAWVFERVLDKVDVAQPELKVEV